MPSRTPCRGAAHGVEGLQDLVGRAPGQDQGQQHARRGGQQKAPYAAQGQAVDGGQGHGGTAHHTVGKTLGHIEHVGAQRVRAAGSLPPAGGGGQFHLGPRTVVVQQRRVGLRIGQYRTVRVDDGQAFFRGGLQELGDHTLRVGDGALGVHEDQQFPEIFPGGLHLPAAEHEHPHEIGDEQGAHHGKQRSPDDTFFHWQDLRK